AVNGLPFCQADILARVSALITRTLMRAAILSFQSGARPRPLLGLLFAGGLPPRFNALVAIIFSITSRGRDRPLRAALNFSLCSGENVRPLAAADILARISGSAPRFRLPATIFAYA